MFQWLSKMLMNTPVCPSSCACGEGRRAELEKMRREIVGEPVEDDLPITCSGSSCSSQSCSEDCKKEE